MTAEILAAQDRLDTVAACWSALADLMCPGDTLSGPARDNLSILMGFLEQEYQSARAALRQAIKPA